MIDSGSRGTAPGALPAALIDTLHERLVDARAPGAPLLIALDVDGTIAPIVPNPEEAAVPAATRRVLAALAARSDTRLAVVSGRGAADAARIVALDHLWVIGNHGAEVVAPDGATSVDPRVAPWAPAIAAAARALAPAAARVAGASVEDKRWSLSLHYRRVGDEREVAALEAAAARVAAESGLLLKHGKKIFELRPPVEVDKGTALLHLARRLGADAPDAALLFAGDDLTDEDAFRALRAEVPRALTIRVLGETAGRGASDAPFTSDAELTVPGLPALRLLLERLDAWLASA